MKPQYCVEVLGFSQTERIVLNSIFGLSARRNPKFVPFGPSCGPVPDLYLVDSGDANSVAQFRQKNALGRPAILIGDANHGLPIPVLPRPLQWAKLFRAFDSAVGIGAQPGAAALAAPATPAPAPAINVARPAAPPASNAHLPTQPLPTIARAPIATPAPTVARGPMSFADLRNTTPVAPPSQPVNTLNASADWVLVCDDNMTVREFMRAKLAPFGFNVDFAESGEQAVGLTGMKHYTCIFLDVVMPGIDGYQVCKLIKSKKAAAKTAVVMLTSKGSTFDKIRGSMSGCDAYLTKPVDEDKLLSVIVKYLPKAV